MNAVVMSGSLRSPQVVFVIASANEKIDCANDQIMKIILRITY